MGLWRKFKMVEISEVMRQRDNFELVSLLNKITEKEINDHVENTLKLHFLKEKYFPQYVVHMFAENKPAKEYNQIQLNTLNI